MKFTVPGKDVIRVTEEDYEDNFITKSDNKIHLIKFGFNNPTFEKIKWVLDSYPYTNRFIVSDNVRTYNNFLKSTNRKYYIENNENDAIISFFKKNNKVILNFFKLDIPTLKYIMDVCLEDVLYNVEIIYINDEMYKAKKNTFDLWKGNIIITNNYNL